MTVLFKPILALHIINFSSCRNYWGGGGGGGGETICLPPPPPPRIDASDYKFSSENDRYIMDHNFITNESLRIIMDINFNFREN